MDPTRDNPIIRFNTFWWGIGTFLIFALLLAILWAFAKSDRQTPEDVAGVTRKEIRQEIDAAQAEAFRQMDVGAAIPTVAAALAASKPAAVERPEQLVPGSPTALALSDAPALDLSAIDAPPADPNAPIDPAVLEIGKAQYLVCAACHGQNGEGGPAGPPLAESEWVNGPVSNLIRIQLRGLIGPITVKGVVYDQFVAGMMPMAYQTDEQIAAALTYIRNNFGNKGHAVTPEQVKALRGEVGKPQLTEAELVKP
jgi:mono/diheme cytochrome c family protein